MKFSSKEPYLQESARDILALGSLAMGLVLVARSTLGSYFGFAYQVLFSFTILFLLSFLVKDYERHLARGVVLMVFIILFYRADRDITSFAIFLAFLFIVMIASAIYLEKDKISILKGIIMGILATLAGYFGAIPLAGFLGLPG